MEVAPRALGIAAAIVGTILWIVAVAVEAPLVAVVLPILLVMGGGVLVARGDGTSGDSSGP